MKSKISIILFVFFLGIAEAQTILTRELEAAREEYQTDTVFNLWLDYQEEPNSLDHFYNSLPENHIVELDQSNPTQATVTYFAKGSEDTDYILQSGGPDFYGLRFKKIGASNYYYCIQKIPKDAFFNYGFNEFRRTKYSLTSNLTQSTMAHIYDGSVIGPDAPLSGNMQLNPKVPRGALKETSLVSIRLNETRKLVVYTPAEQYGEGPFNLVIQLDGQNYSRAAEHGKSWEGWTPMPTIIDNLMNNRQISPTVVVMVLNQGNRSNDMLDDAFYEFIALELVPWAKENFTISPDKSNVIVSGPSRAGFAAARTAMKYPNVIGGVLAQSGSFYYTLGDKTNWPIYPEYEGKLLEEYKTSPLLPIRFYLDIGLYDLGLAGVGTNRQFKDILQLKGYKVKYDEYKGGHSHLSWRNRLDEGLIYLLPNVEE